MHTRHLLAARFLGYSVRRRNKFGGRLSPLLREGIAALVNPESDMKLVAECIRLQDGAKSPVTGDRIGRTILTSTAP